MTIVEMQMNIDCDGCEDNVRKALLRLQGVHYVDVDRARDKVTVTGTASQKKVLRVARRTRKLAHAPPPLALVSVRLLMFTPLELSLLAGDLAITRLSTGMDIWIEWYPPETYAGVRSKKEEIGPRKLDRRTKR